LSFGDKGYTAKKTIDFLIRSNVVAFSYGLAAVEDATGSADGKYGSGKKTHGPHEQEL